MDPQFVIDVNLTHDWVDFLQAGGYGAVHWSAVGPGAASDPEIMAWAVQNGYVVFTADLDFAMLLVMTHATGPSVLQLRADIQTPAAIGPDVLAAIRQFEQELVAGALVTVDPARSRVRVLPIVP